MPFTSTFTTLALDELHDKAQALRDEGWRFVNIHAVHVEQGCDLYYVFEREGLFENFRIEGVTKEHDVPSITDLFFAAFVFENETRELFGVNMRDIALDFDGSFYGRCSCPAPRALSSTPAPSSTSAWPGWDPGPTGCT